MSESKKDGNSCIQTPERFQRKTQDAFSTSLCVADKGTPYPELEAKLNLIA